MAVDHYENFPVASVLLPRRLRAAVTDIYRYARTADDIADEGDARPEERLRALASYRDALAQIGHGIEQWPAHDLLAPIFGPLTDTVRRHALPLQPFYDLISAFEQDVTVQQYETLPQLMEYCRRSANPVGRLMLHLYRCPDAQYLEWSDAICTGLQLTNFWQDVAIDWQKDRVYIPQDAFTRHGLTPDYIGQRASNPAAVHERELDVAWQTMMGEQVGLARRLLLSGMPLTTRLPGRVGFELKLVIHGGLRILERLDQLHYDIFQYRPTLEKRDWILLLWRALMPA